LLLATNCSTSDNRRKKEYYIEEFNPTYNHHQKAYIGTNISWRAKMLIVRLRTNSHQLHCETGRWKRPKEAWKERVCVFCTSEKVEIEKHFILECEAFKDRDSYISILTTSSWNNLFSERIVEKLRELIIKLNKKRVELQKSVCETVCPIGYC
jgi:hypothetical protein